MKTKGSPRQNNEKTATGKNAKTHEQLHTEPPISEKDEVKQAEERTKQPEKSK